MEPLEVEIAGFYAKENSQENHTELYDLVNAEQPTPIFRRGCNFYFSVRFNRDYDEENDVVRIGFGFGKKDLIYSKK